MEVLTDAVPECLWSFFEELDEHPWLFSAIASMLVGLSGILPLLVIPIDETANFNDGPGAATLRVLLSFAVGGLLGDVFLHLLPEAWENDLRNTKEGEHVSMKCGLWVLFGMLVFIVVEKLFAVPEHEDEDATQKDKDKERQKEKEKQKHKEKERQKEKEKRTERNGSASQLEIEELHKFLEVEKKKRQRYSSVTEGGAELPACDAGEDPGALYASCLFNNNSPGEVGLCGESACNGVIANGVSGGRCVKGNRWMGRCLLREAAARADRDPAPADNKKHVAGYLNLMANSIDNFTHGLAVGGSFLVGFRVGVLTTFAILVHEIPHEVGDFAILLRSGFSRWEAAKAQMATATAGLVGAMTAVIFSGASNAIEAKTSWIVPFTAGGFLHIALVTVLPDLLREDDKWESLKHLAALVLGISVMAFMTQYFG